MSVCFVHREGGKVCLSQEHVSHVHTFPLFVCSTKWKLIGGKTWRHREEAEGGLSVPKILFGKNDPTKWNLWTTKSSLHFLFVSSCSVLPHIHFPLFLVPFHPPFRVSPWKVHLLPSEDRDKRGISYSLIVSSSSSIADRRRKCGLCWDQTNMWQICITGCQSHDFLWS